MVAVPVFWRWEAEARGMGKGSAGPAVGPELPVKSFLKKYLSIFPGP